MFVVESKAPSSAVYPVVYFDVDDTLVMWGRPRNDPEGVFIKTDCRFADGEKLWLVPHKVHITKLKAYKDTGAKVIVWSAGGGQWAKDVVTQLGLENYVDACLPKPDIAYDDLPADEVLPRTSYLTE